MPWMIAMPTLLVAVFIGLATTQLIRFNQTLNDREKFDVIGTVIPSLSSSALNEVNIHDKAYIQWLTLTKLEQESYNLRYKQAGALLMSRIFTKYLGFFTGMILAIVGAVFIIGKLKEGSSKLEFSASGSWKASVLSSSPGVIFGFLGTVLMIATILTHNEITVKDQPLYLNANSIASMELINLLSKEYSDPEVSKKANELRDLILKDKNQNDIKSTKADSTGTTASN